MRELAIAGLLILTASLLPGQTVLVKPYVQPGRAGSGEVRDASLIWFTDAVPGEFKVEYRVNDQSRSAAVQSSELKFTKAPGKMPEPHPEESETPKETTSLLPPEKEQHYRRYSTRLDPLPLDAEVSYRVTLGSQVVRDDRFRTPRSAKQSVRFVAVGDLANGKPAQYAIAHHIAAQKPDFVLALGDLVYPNGRMNQYMHYFFNTYNDVTEAGPKTGAPLMASVPFYALLGNHDVAAKYPVIPDALAAYYVFRAPDTGPGFGPWVTSAGSERNAAALFRQLTPGSYPNLDAYSFDNGPAHFVILNSNRSGNADDVKLRAWAEKDLKASTARWKFVALHVPPFQSSSQHYTEQAFRAWAPLFEECGVDIVWAGHVHNYQRSVPLEFKPLSAKRDKRGRVDGHFTLDREFDGENRTRPRGVIYIVAGGGGATLYGPGLEKTAQKLRTEHGANYADFTTKMVADRHSFVTVDLTPDQLSLKVLDSSGVEIDRCRITKPGGQ